MKLLFVTVLVVLASASIDARAIQQNHQKDLADFVINQLGLAPVWETIQGLGTNAVAQILSEGMQLLVSGKDKLAQAQAIFAQLVSDLKDHGIQTAQTASAMVAQAIRDVAAILSSSEKRDLADFIVNQLGLGSVWEEIQNLGANTVAQLIQEGLQLLTSGKEVFAQAKEIFAQLAKDLIAHTGVASNLVQAAIAQVAELLKKPEAKRDLADFIVNQLGLGSVWEEIQNLGANTVAQLIQEGLQLLTSGKEVFAQAKEIFAQLAKDLIAHTGVASNLVQAAIAQVAELLKDQKQKRDLADFIVNQLGLGSVWEEIQNLGGNTVAQLIQEGLQLLTSGKEVVAQAKEIFDKLVQDLINHTGTASGLVQAAIAQVAELLKDQKQKRDLADILVNQLGLGQVWEEIQNLGGNVVAQLLNEAMQLVFAGQDVLAQAQAIFSQLVSDLINHTGVASNLVQAAIAQVAELLKKPAF